MVFFPVASSLKMVPQPDTGTHPIPPCSVVPKRLPALSRITLLGSAPSALLRKEYNTLYSSADPSSKTVPQPWPLGHIGSVLPPPKMVVPYKVPPAVRSRIPEGRSPSEP